MTPRKEMNWTALGNRTPPHSDGFTIPAKCSSCVYGVSTWPFSDSRPSFGTIVISVVCSVIGLFGILICLCIAYDGLNRFRGKVRRLRMNEDDRKMPSAHEMVTNANRQIIQPSASCNLSDSPAK